MSLVRLRITAAIPSDRGLRSLGWQQAHVAPGHPWTPWAPPASVPRWRGGVGSEGALQSAYRSGALLFCLAHALAGSLLPLMQRVPHAQPRLIRVTGREPLDPVGIRDLVLVQVEEGSKCRAVLRPRVARF